MAGWLNRILPARESIIREGELATALHRLEEATESLAQLELMAEDKGWERLGAGLAQDISRDGLNRMASLVRVMSVANPLMKRAKRIRASYVFGQGVEINARAQGEDGAQDVDAVVQEFLDDEGNRDAVTGAQARTSLEGDLFDEGNVFLANFTNPLTGRVQVRPLPFNEITEIITEPGDRTAPWYYRRKWVESTPTSTFGMVEVEREALYPSLKYQPLTRPRTLGGVDVFWDAPVLHVKANPVGSKVWGIGDGYAALPWCRAYKDFLEDWALLMRSLSRIAWQSKTGKGSNAQLMRESLRKAMGPDGTAGGVASMTADTQLEAVSKSGATLDAESGRPLAAMIAAAVGVTVTILLADPGQTGARAVAETLDLPMRLEMRERQELWAQAYRAMCGYVVEQAVIAPAGPLEGSRVQDGDRLYVTLAGDTDPTIETHFPDLDSIPLADLMKAIEVADGTGYVPPLEILKLILRALNIRDIDEILDQVTDDNGDFISPGVTAGQAATDRFRAGEDPATIQ